MIFFKWKWINKIYTYKYNTIVLLCFWGGFCFLFFEVTRCFDHSVYKLNYIITSYIVCSCLQYKQFHCKINRYIRAEAYQFWNFNFYSQLYITYIRIQVRLIQNFTYNFYARMDSIKIIILFLPRLRIWSTINYFDNRFNKWNNNNYTIL